MQKDNRLYQLAENVLKNSVKRKKGRTHLFSLFTALLPPLRKGHN